MIMQEILRTEHAIINYLADGAVAPKKSAIHLRKEMAIYNIATAYKENKLHRDD